MKKIFNYSFLVIFLISAITLIYSLFNLSGTSGVQLMSLVVFCFISFIFYTMSEEGASNDTVNRGYATLILIAIAVIILLFMSSCSRYVSVQDAANGRARCGQSLK